MITACDLFPDAPPRPAAAAVPVVAGDGQPLTLAEIRDAAERTHIERTLEPTTGGIPEAAQRLGISRTTLWEKMRRLGISVD